MDLEINDMNKNIIDDLLQYGERVTLECKKAETALPKYLSKTLRTSLYQLFPMNNVIKVKLVDKNLAAKKGRNCRRKLTGLCMSCKG